MMTAIGALRGSPFDSVNDLARNTSWLHEPLLAYASYGVGVFAVLLVAGWWRARTTGVRQVTAALWTGAATLLAVGLNQPLVGRFHEARPYTAEPAILLLAKRSADFSFPSDHAVMAGAVAAGLWLVSTRLAVIATVAALLMGFARVYIGAHYPHDVLAGLALGATVSIGGWLLLQRPMIALVRWLASSPAGFLVTAGPPVPPARDHHGAGATV